MLKSLFESYCTNNINKNISLLIVYSRLSMYDIVIGHGYRKISMSLVVYSAGLKIDQTNFIFGYVLDYDLSLLDVSCH